MPKKRTVFKEWIEEQGVEELTRKLNVEKNTINYWRAGFSIPRPWQMQKIVKLSRGAVSYQDIIEGHLNSESWRK